MYADVTEYTFGGYCKFLCLQSVRVRMLINKYEATCMYYMDPQCMGNIGEPFGWYSKCLQLKGTNNFDTKG